MLHICSLYFTKHSGSYKDLKDCGEIPERSLSFTTCIISFVHCLNLKDEHQPDLCLNIQAAPRSKHTRSRL